MTAARDLAAAASSTPFQRSNGPNLTRSTDQFGVVANRRWILCPSPMGVRGLELQRLQYPLRTVRRIHIFDLDQVHGRELLIVSDEFDYRLNRRFTLGSHIAVIAAGATSQQLLKPICEGMG